MRLPRTIRLSWLATGAVACGAMAAPAAFAATLCVNPNPHSGCYSTIAAAVGAAGAGDTVAVAPGIYNESVTITKPLSLIGAGAPQTTIDAAGQPNGIFIDGFVDASTPGHNTLSQVTVSGFTVKNANFEGILVRNASQVTLRDNNVRNNDRALDPQNGTCAGISAFETNEGFDCGEGIHLIGVDHSTVTGNTSAGNAGGILLSDETGPTDANVIAGNSVHDNPFDCGITLASHAPATISGSSLPFGVFDNTIMANDSFNNGLGVNGGGAGVGLFAPGPGNQNYGNVVVGNRLTGNGQPGVAIHNHAPPIPNKPKIVLANNVIVGNFIAGNGPDPDVETGASAVATGISLLGATPVTGTVITGNVITKESTDIAINNAGDVVDVHLNNLLGGGAGIANLGAGAVAAGENWWGCPRGPGAAGCTSVSGANVVTTPFLTQPVRPAAAGQGEQGNNNGNG